MPYNEAITIVKEERTTDMFRALDKRIKLILILVVLTYIGLASFIVFRTIKDQTMVMQQQLSVKYTEQQNKNVQLYMQWLEETTRLALNHPGLQDTLMSDRYDETLVPILDGLRSSNLDISAIIIFGVKGTKYSTSNISGIKSYSAVQDDPVYSRFLASDETSRWLIQSPYKLVSYPNDPRMMLYYIEKIMDEQGQLQGLLFLESSLSKLFTFYHSNEHNLSGHSQVSFLTENDEVLMDNEALGEQRKEEILRAASTHMPREQITMLETNDGIVLLYRLYKSDDRVVILLNTDKLGGQLNWLKNALLVVNIAIAALFIFLIMQLSRSISEPLAQLHRRMRSTMKEP